MDPLSNQWQQLPEIAIRRLQADRLRDCLGAAILPFSARYQKLFRENNLSADSIRTLDDLARVPFTSKSDLLNTPESPQRFRDFVLVPDQQILARRPGTIFRALLHGRDFVREKFEADFRPIFMTFTTGRSTEPIPFLYTQRDLTNLAIAGKRVMEVCAARREDRLLNAFPYAPHLAFWLTHYAGTAFGAMMFSSGGGKVMGTDGTLRLIRKLKPDIFVGVPTFVYHVLNHAVAEGLRWENLRYLVLGGEKVSDGLREKLRELARRLGAPKVEVLAIYGFTESKLAWPECPFPPDQPSPGYHLYPDLGIVEIINPKTGETVPNGQPGEIVFTPLAARGTVVLRYRTGDCIDGGLTYEPCPYCHRSVPRLVGRISRNSEIKEMNLDKIKGTLVDFNELEHVLDDAPHIGAWQVELRKVHDDPLELDEIILHVNKTNGIDEAWLGRELSERCYNQIDIHPNQILFHEVEEMQRLQGLGILLKEQRLVDNRPKTKSLS
jgi:phenylacetate-coenzyme A ligase PaaK-like adenylate-forming protein